MKTYDNLGEWTYEELVGEIDSLRDSIVLQWEMSDEQARQYKAAYESEGRELPANWRAHLIDKDSRLQVAIVRECLRRVDVGRLSEDTGFPEDSLLVFAAHTDSPDAN